MSFSFGFLAGVLSAILLFSLGYCYSIIFKIDDGAGVTVPVPVLAARGKTKKKTPKAISELELWKKEQAETPLDPGL